MHTGDYPPGWEKKVKVINLPAPSEKVPTKPRSAAKFKSASKTKPATPLPSAGAPLAVRTRGSKRKTTPHPVSATEQRVSPFFLLLLSFLIRFLNYLAANSPTFFLPFSFQSKYKEDSSAARPIFLDDPKPEVSLFSLLLFPFFLFARICHGSSAPTPFLHTHHFFFFT